jgi:hypothetical protein
LERLPRRYLDLVLPDEGFDALAARDTKEELADMQGGDSREPARRMHEEPAHVG